MKKRRTALRRVLSCVLVMVCTLMLVSGCDNIQKPVSALDPENPVTVTVWNYYNGDQLTAFETLVEEFNGTVGLEKGIVVISVSQGDISTLADSLIASVNGDAGAQEIPTLAAVYAETAYILDKAEALEALDPYFNGEELAAFVPGFIDEGRFNAENELMLFPILKSTEIFTVNETDWAPFAEATGITIESIATKEDLTAAAEAYYNWTDSLTPGVADDGKALYGRDSVANYVYLGCCQLGHEMFKIEDGELTVDLDRDSFKTLWDNYYIPFVKGYFGAYGRFRSDDCKTGKILALTSSSSSSSYIPTAITLEDDSTYDISVYQSKPLPFKNAVNDAVVQQGASYCLLKSTPGQQEGAVEFLKWFTQSDRNLSFALMAGYSPVTLAANTEIAITAAYTGETTSQKGQNILEALVISADVFTNDMSFATKPFSGSKEVRAIIDDSLDGVATADRAAVVAAMQAGTSREEALAPYLSDEYFDAWFSGVSEQVNAAVGA